ncbi:hypothetical protein ACKWTF_016764 [Chironomus riparius]
MNQKIILIIILSISSFVESGKLKKCFELSKCNEESKIACRGKWIEKSCECQCIQKEECKLNLAFNPQTCQCECHQDPKCPSDRWMHQQCRCLKVSARRFPKIA